MVVGCNFTRIDTGGGLQDLVPELYLTRIDTDREWIEMLFFEKSMV